MKQTDTIVALAALEQKLDTVLFGKNDDEDHTGRNIAVGAGGVAAAGGAVAADRAVMRKYGTRQLLGNKPDVAGSPRSILSRAVDNGVAAGGTASAGRLGAYRAAVSDAGSKFTNAGRAGLRAGKQAFRVSRHPYTGTSVLGSNLLGSVAKGLRKGAKVAVRNFR